VRIISKSLNKLYGRITAMKMLYKSQFLKDAYVYKALDNAGATLTVLDNGFAIGMQETFMIFKDESRNSKIVGVDYIESLSSLYVNVYNASSGILREITFDTYNLVILGTREWKDRKDIIKNLKALDRVYKEKE